MVVCTHYHRGPERLLDKPEVTTLPGIHRTHVRLTRWRNANRFDLDRARLAKQVQKQRRHAAVEFRAGRAMWRGTPDRGRAT